jgi:hypothetical protein
MPTQGRFSFIQGVVTNDNWIIEDLNTLSSLRANRAIPERRLLNESVADVIAYLFIAHPLARHYSEPIHNAASELLPDRDWLLSLCFLTGSCCSHLKASRGPKISP